MAAILPQASDLGRALSGLLGRRVTLAKAGQVMTVERANPDLHTGLYVTAQRKVTTIISCDKTFAANSAAALGMFPSQKAAEWLNQAKMPQEATENFHEVLNVMAATLNDADSRNHVKLAEVLAPGRAVPAPISVVDRPATRADYVVDIDGYPQGRLSLLSN